MGAEASLKIANRKFKIANRKFPVALNPDQAGEDG